jgi:hypothetical protein
VPSSADDIAFDRAYVEAFGLYGFVKLAWPKLKPGIPFADGWHAQRSRGSVLPAPCDQRPARIDEERQH